MGILRARCNDYLGGAFDLLDPSKEADHPALSSYIVDKDQRAEVLAAAGEFSKAFRSLAGTARILKPSPDIIAKIGTKFPVVANPFTGSPSPVPLDSPSLSNEDILRAIARLPHRSAQDAWGYRYEHWQVLVAIGLDDLICHIVSGLHQGTLSAPEAVRASWTGGRVIPYAKASSPNDPRPICILLTLRRIISRAVIAKNKNRFAKFFEPYQLGVGARGGAETIVQSARALLRAHDKAVIASIDIANAFNSLDHTSISSLIGRYFPEEASWFRACYGYASSFLPTRGPSIQNVWSGVSQGDPLASFYCSLVMWQLASTIAEEFPLVTPIFYADNGHFFSTDYNFTCGALSRLDELLAGQRLHLNAAHSSLFGPGLPPYARTPLNRATPGVAILRCSCGPSGFRQALHHQQGRQVRLAGLCSSSHLCIPAPLALASSLLLFLGYVPLAHHALLS